tara:strand:- start:183 stop:1049 length:867 start_codon:yes stop_codon:yes gene_type:complete
VQLRAIKLTINNKREIPMCLFQKTILSLLAVLTVGSAYATTAQIRISNNSSRVHLTHCVHFQPESGKWDADEVKYTKKYDNQTSFDISIDGSGYFACEAYAAKQGNKTSSKSLAASIGDLDVNVKHPFPTENVYVGTKYEYESIITNTGNDAHSVQITIPDLPVGIDITKDTGSDCWSGAQGKTLQHGESCTLKLGMTVSKSDIKVDEKWFIAFENQNKLIQRLKFSTLDSHGSQQVAMLEMYLENDKQALVNWLPYDRNHAGKMDVLQTLGAHLEMSQDASSITIVD